MEAANAAEAVEILQATRDRFMADGWWAITDRPKLPGMAYTGDCTMNTLFRIFRDRGQRGFRALQDQVLSYLMRAGGFTSTLEIQNWNDDEASGINDVLDLYDEAILLAKEAELAAPVSDSEPTS